MYTHSIQRERIHLIFTRLKIFRFEIKLHFFFAKILSAHQILSISFYADKPLNFALYVCAILLCIFFSTKEIIRFLLGLKKKGNQHTYSNKWYFFLALSNLKLK